MASLQTLDLAVKVSGTLDKLDDAANKLDKIAKKERQVNPVKIDVDVDSDDAIAELEAIESKAESIDATINADVNRSVSGDTVPEMETSGGFEGSQQINYVLSRAGELQGQLTEFGSQLDYDTEGLNEQLDDFRQNVRDTDILDDKAYDDLDRQLQGIKNDIGQVGLKVYADTSPFQEKVARLQRNLKQTRNTEINQEGGFQTDYDELESQIKESVENVSATVDGIDVSVIEERVRENVSSITEKEDITELSSEEITERVEEREYESETVRNLTEEHTRRTIENESTTEETRVQERVTEIVEGGELPSDVDGDTLTQYVNRQLEDDGLPHVEDVTQTVNRSIKPEFEGTFIEDKLSDLETSIDGQLDVERTQPIVRKLKTEFEGRGLPQLEQRADELEQILDRDEGQLDTSLVQSEISNFRDALTDIEETTVDVETNVKETSVDEQLQSDIETTVEANVDSDFDSSEFATQVRETLESLDIGSRQIDFDIDTDFDRGSYREELQNFDRNILAAQQQLRELNERSDVDSDVDFEDTSAMRRITTMRTALSALDNITAHPEVIVDRETDDGRLQFDNLTEDEQTTVEQKVGQLSGAIGRENKLLSQSVMGEGLQTTINEPSHQSPIPDVSDFPAIDPPENVQQSQTTFANITQVRDEQGRFTGEMSFEPQEHVLKQQRDEQGRFIGNDIFSGERPVDVGSFIDNITNNANDGSFGDIGSLDTEQRDFSGFDFEQYHPDRELTFKESLRSQYDGFKERVSGRLPDRVHEAGKPRERTGMGRDYYERIFGNANTIKAYGEQAFDKSDFIAEGRNAEDLVDDTKDVGVDDVFNYERRPDLDMDDIFESERSFRSYLDPESDTSLGSALRDDRELTDLSADSSGIKGALSDISDVNMSTFYNALAKVVPLLFTWIGAMPSAIVGILGLGAAALSAAAALGAVGGLALGGLALVLGGGNLQKGFAEIKSQLLQRAKNAFYPVMRMFDDLGMDGLQGAKDFLSALANEAMALARLKQEIRGFGSWVSSYVLSLVPVMIALAEAFAPVAGMFGEWLSQNTVGVINMLVDHAAKVLPLILEIIDAFLQMAPALLKFSQGLLIATTIMFKFWGIIWSVVNALGPLGKWLGIGVGLLLSFYTMISLATWAGGVFSTILGVSAVRSLIAFIGGLGRAVMALFGYTVAAGEATLATTLLSIAIGTLLAMTGIGILIAIFGGIASGASMASSEIDKATKSLKNFKAMKNGMSGFGEGVNNPYGPLALGAKTQVVVNEDNSVKKTESTTNNTVEMKNGSKKEALKIGQELDHQMFKSSEKSSKPY